MSNQKENAKRLLKKAAEVLEEQPQDQGAPEPQEPKPRSGLSEARKRALINYMAILFAVAFLLVALSLGIQYRDSQNTISQLGANASNAMEKADKLQEENRQLQNQIQELQGQVDLLTEQLNDTKTALTESETEGDLLDGANQELFQEKLAAEERVEAYQLLARAGNAYSMGDLETFHQTMDQLESRYSRLDEADLILYQKLLVALNEENM